MRGADLWLGVDAGETNTDAVVMDTRHHLVAKAKVSTTADVRSGIGTAISRVVGHRDVDPARVTRAMLGTASAIGAIADRKGLTRVAVVRIGAPLTLALPPLATWPATLRAAVSAGERVIGGGADYDGRVAAPLDEEALARFLNRVSQRADAVAIAGVFSPVAPEQELRAAEVVRRELGAAMHVSLSHEIGSLGLLERENAAVLNAALVGVIEDLARALDQTLSAEGIVADPFFAQNDGAVMALGHALRFPLLMVGSGPASGMRGAAFLSGIEEGVVVDIGGSSTHVGVLVHGFPRASSLQPEIGGVRMDFRMPDFFTVPLGGGSVVCAGESPPAARAPSVAHRLVDEALVFGGRTADDDGRGGRRRAREDRLAFPDRARARHARAGAPARRRDAGRRGRSCDGVDGGPCAGRRRGRERDRRRRLPRRARGHPPRRRRRCRGDRRGHRPRQRSGRQDLPQPARQAPTSVWKRPAVRRARGPSTPAPTRTAWRSWRSTRSR